jgi:hypothetical protein
MRPCIYLTALAQLIVMFNTGAAFGQTPRASVSATYTFLRDTALDSSFERGVSLGGAYRIHHGVFVSAELALSGHHQDFLSSQGGTYDFWYESLQAGPRLSPFQGRVQPYVEVLAGATRLGIWERRLDQTGDWGAWEFSLQPALGIEIPVSRRVALRFGGDLRLVFKHDTRFDGDYRVRLYRLNAGVAFHLGRS